MLDYDYSWVVKDAEGRYTIDAVTARALCGDNPDSIPDFELKKRMSVIVHLNEGWLVLRDDLKEKSDNKLLKAAKKLREVMVITENPYSKSNNYRELMIYRMRLFSERERQVLRNGLRKPGSAWECIEGGAGLMDELEMVRMESNGKLVKDLKGTI